MKETNKRNTTGGNIKKIRESLGLSLREFGAKIGVSANSISRWERNLFQPSDIYIKKIAKLADLDETEILIPSNNLLRESIKKAIVEQLKTNKEGTELSVFDIERAFIGKLNSYNKDDEKIDFINDFLDILSTKELTLLGTCIIEILAERTADN